MRNTWCNVSLPEDIFLACYDWLDTGNSRRTAGAHARGCKPRTLRRKSLQEKPSSCVCFQSSLVDTLLVYLNYLLAHLFFRQISASCHILRCLYRLLFQHHHDNKLLFGFVKLPHLFKTMLVYMKWLGNKRLTEEHLSLRSFRRPGGIPRDLANPANKLEGEGRRKSQRLSSQMPKAWITPWHTLANCRIHIVSTAMMIAEGPPSLVWLQN